MNFKTNNSSELRKTTYGQPKFNKWPQVIYRDKYCPINETLTVVLEFSFQVEGEKRKVP